MTYGLLIGAGMSTVYSPLLTTVTRWFSKRRGLALGIVMAGVGVGILVISPFASYLIIKYGWRTSYLIMGPVIGGIIITAAWFLRKDPSQKGMVPNGKRISEILDKENDTGEIIKGNDPASDITGLSLGESVGTKAFWILCIMNLLTGIGPQIIFVHIVPYVLKDLKVSLIIGATILSCIGGASIAGRLITGAASDYIGRKSALAISTAIEGVMIIGIAASSSAWMLYLFATIYGFGYGGHTTQFPAMTGEFFGLRRMGTILGATSILYGVGGALGPYLAGLMFDKSGSYTNGFILGAIAMLLTAGFTFLLKKPKAVGS